MSRLSSRGARANGIFIQQFYARRQTEYAVPARLSAAIAAFGWASVTLAAGILPQGGSYVAGAGAITRNGNNVIITQPGSSRGVIDWTSFSIGTRNSVTFENGDGATLNRVTGGSPALILGKLSATGSLYLINPQGVVVGPGGVVSTGGRFVASTLDAGNNEFINSTGTLTLSGQSGAPSLIWARSVRAAATCS